MKRMRCYTTTEIAKICGVATRTVAKWIDSGWLVGFRLPGNYRRVLESELIRFMEHHSIPLELLPEGKNESK